MKIEWGEGGAENWYLSMVGIACCNLGGGGEFGGIHPQENLHIPRLILVHFEGTLIDTNVGQCHV